MAYGIPQGGMAYERPYGAGDPYGSINQFAQESVPSAPAPGMSLAASAAGYSLMSSVAKPGFLRNPKLDTPIGMGALIQGGNPLFGFGGAYFYTGNPILGIGGALLAQAGGLANMPWLKDTEAMKLFSGTSNLTFAWTPVKDPKSNLLELGKDYTRYDKRYSGLSKAESKVRQEFKAMKNSRFNVGYQFDEKDFKQDRMGRIKSIKNKVRAQMNVSGASAASLGQKLGIKIKSGNLSIEEMMEFSDKFEPYKVAAKKRIKEIPGKVSATAKTKQRLKKSHKMKDEVERVKGANARNYHHQSLTKSFSEENLKEALRKDKAAGRHKYREELETRYNKRVKDLGKELKQRKAYVRKIDVAREGLGENIFSQAVNRQAASESLLFGRVGTQYADDVLNLHGYKGFWSGIFSGKGVRKVDAARSASQVAMNKSLGLMNKTMRENVYKQYGLTGYVDNVDDAAKLISGRIEVGGSFVRAAKIAKGVTFALIAKDLAVGAVKVGMKGLDTLNSYMGKLRELEFGGPGTVVQTQGASTERQRALEGLRNSTMNARQFIGQEAALLHN